MVKRSAFSMIELIFAIVIIAVMMLSLPMMTDVTSSGSLNTMKAEEAIFEAYVKLLDVTDGGYDTLENEDNVSLTDNSGVEEGLKFAYKADVSITSGSGFGDRDSGDDNISLVSVTVKDEDGNEIAKMFSYDFNVTR
ncbi:hypothetical protein MNB_SM-7-1416 [hydrothermal vent metagenome]|uniref:Uncharacterized protein n=1 Tax=hydrothermal vent metagenome TaxID=652676 RepID=A0A1W1BWF6_9ZZZZ